MRGKKGLFQHKEQANPSSIAKAIVNSAQGRPLYLFVSLSNVICGVQDVKDTIDEARKMRVKNNKTAFC